MLADGFSAKRGFSVIPNGKDPVSFRFDSAERQRAREMLDINDDTIAIGHVGRINEQKNHSFLLNVFKSFLTSNSEARLYLIGDDGGLMSEVRKRVRELGLQDKVLFLGRRTDVSELLNGMDCMVFPSLYEGFPNVVVDGSTTAFPV